MSDIIISKPDHEWAGKMQQSSMENLEKATRLRLMIARWNIKEPCPASATFEVDTNIKINPADKMTEMEFHTLLAWAVRMSGQKFRRSFDPIWDTIKWETAIYKATDELGQFDTYITIRNAPLGDCKIVEETVTKKVKKMVCGGKAKEISSAISEENHANQTSEQENRTADHAVDQTAKAGD